VIDVGSLLNNLEIESENVEVAIDLEDLELKIAIIKIKNFAELPCENFVQKVVPQVKNLSLFVTAFKDLYVSRVLLY
jgi:hypothetical protein